MSTYLKAEESQEAVVTLTKLSNLTSEAGWNMRMGLETQRESIGWA